ncbi:MAG: 50S ribosomal protein L15 [Candidatus Omnitrophica bacterium]|nr:50S ribosomal protein L15 [Candidatus Omnitrophota bacterium]
MKIENVRRPKGANRPPKRYGRGSGSGHGKTAGRGSKGAKSRSGPGLRIGFEGGQMPLMRRLPKRGFTSKAKKVYQVVNVEGLNRFRKDSVVDRASLGEVGLIKDIELPVKILGTGDITKPLTVLADAYSANARKKIAAAGGKTDKPETK